ncbi:MAG: SPOR domain-containing protein [Ignavibacteriae bacterium]|nr:SPOR domain-containing protein [Ignavibacteriota bacterium]MCB9215148.1 SPOR domain-containing protein [Ignavibacteria bacterium]
MNGYDEQNGGDQMRGRDASRLGALINRGEEDGSRTVGNSIPMPGFEGAGEDAPEEVWNASGAMTLNDYQRLRRGYERGINPEALERMEEAQTVTELPRPVVSSAPPIRIEPEVWREPETVEVEEIESTRKRGIGPVAVTAILLVGIFGALILYAGGVAYITGLFTGDEPVSEENLTMVTERPQDQVEEIDPTGALTPGEEMELADQEATESEEKEAAEKKRQEEEQLAKEKEKERLEAERKEKEATALKAQKEATEKKETLPTTQKPERAIVKAQVEEPKEGSDRTTVLTATPPSKQEVAKTTSTAGKYTVQVGATPDKSEADRIAARVRSKGGSNVQVIASEKNGEKIYRVRFGSFGTQEEAKAKAIGMGFGDIWVVKK